MGNVLLVYKVVPEDQDQIDVLEAKLRKVDCAKLQDVKKEPFVFGMMVLKFACIVPDKVDGAIEKVEAFISKIDGIQSFENEVTTLIS